MSICPQRSRARILVAVLSLAGGTVLPIRGFAHESKTADEPLFNVDRPDTSESSYTVPRGYFQAELGIRVLRQGAGSKAHSYFVDNLFRIGVQRNWEVRVGGGAPAYLDSPTRRAGGASPLYLGLKNHFADEKGAFPSMGWLLNVNVPSPSTGFSSGRVDGSLLFVSNKSLGQSEIELNVGPGLAWDAESGTYFGQVVYAATFSHYPRKTLRFYAELFGASPGSSAGLSAVHGGIGIHWYDFRRMVAVDAGFTTGVSRIARDANRLSLFVGFTLMR